MPISVDRVWEPDKVSLALGELLNWCSRDGVKEAREV